MNDASNHHPDKQNQELVSLLEILDIQNTQISTFSSYLDTATAQAFVLRVKELTSLPEESALDNLCPLDQAHEMIPCGMKLEAILREFSDVKLTPP